MTHNENTDLFIALRSSHREIQNTLRFKHNTPTNLRKGTKKTLETNGPLERLAAGFCFFQLHEHWWSDWAEHSELKDWGRQ